MEAGGNGTIFVWRLVNVIYTVVKFCLLKTLFHQTYKKYIGTEKKNKNKARFSIVWVERELKYKPTGRKIKWGKTDIPRTDVIVGRVEEKNEGYSNHILWRNAGGKVDTALFYLGRTSKKKGYKEGFFKIGESTFIYSLWDENAKEYCKKGMVQGLFKDFTCPNGGIVFLEETL